MLRLLERLLSKLKEEAKANLQHHLYLPPFPFLVTASDGALLTNKKVCMCEALFSASCSSSIKYAAERLLSKLKEEAKANLQHHLYLPPFPFLKTASDGALLTPDK
jgi:hypothetical protein